MNCSKTVLLAATCALLSPLSAQTENELPRPTFGTIAVRLQADGTLTGTVGHIDPSSLELVPIPGVNLDFVQNGRLAARAVSGPDGEIAVRGLSPQAVYSLVGRATYGGQRWIMAHGVSVLAPQGGEASAALSSRPAYRLTAARAARSRLEQMAGPSLGLAMIPESDLGSDSDSSAPVIGGGFVGGGGGGGGGGLGGGGWAAAALAAAIAIAASDDDDFELATPFRP